MEQLNNATEAVLLVMSKAQENVVVSKEEIILVCELYLATKDAYLGMKQANEATTEALRMFREKIQ